MKIVIPYLDWTGSILRHFSGPLVGLGLPLAVALLVPGEFAFRAVGFILQALGVWVVWREVGETRRQFAVPTWWAETKSLVARFPGRRRLTLHASSGTILASMTLSARANVWSGVPDDASVEQRLEALEKNVRRVRDDLSAHQNESDTRARTHDEAMNRERAEREAADAAIHEKIKETETGGLHLSWSGAFWLFSGTVCSTFPGELSRWFS